MHDNIEGSPVNLSNKKYLL